jgi:tetratricopeptide (TPR) repeat protein
MREPVRTLDEATHARIAALSEAGDALAYEGSFDAAVEKYHEALRLVPEPHREWEAATWLHVAVGDARFHQKAFELAFRALVEAVHSPGGLGNPFVHLRLGQAALELGDRARARDELIRAYMGAGADIFAEDDPKYFGAIADLM